MEKWTQEQIQKEVELRAEKMEEIVIGQTVKEGVVSLAMLMDCCFAAVSGMMPSGEDSSAIEIMQIEKEIALALFDAMVKQSLMGQQAQQRITLPGLQSFMSKS